MALRTIWGPALFGEDDKMTAHATIWAQTVAYYMMFLGIQRITEDNVRDMAIRWIMWDAVVSDIPEGYSVAKLVKVLTPFIGTTANVAPKTFHTFLTGDVKRIAKDHGLTDTKPVATRERPTITVKRPVTK